MMALVGWLFGLVVIGLLTWNVGISLWWLCLLIPIYTVMYFFLSYVLIGRREHREVDGRLQIREGRGDWWDFEEHMKRDHPKEWLQLEKDKTNGN